MIKLEDIVRDMSAKGVALDEELLNYFSELLERVYKETYNKGFSDGSTYEKRRIKEILGL